MLSKNHGAFLGIDGGKISNIVILGMGGSGIVGDYVRVLMRNSPLPVHVHKGPLPPKYVDRDTLVIAVTFSGKTTETLEALNLCQMAGANSIVVTSSQELELVCSKRNIPSILVPQNGYSRASLGYMLVPILNVLHHIRFLPSIDSDISETIEILTKIKGDCGPNLPFRTNPAGLLALALANRFPVIYGEYDFTDVVALRWKQQLNENAKVQCYYDVFPELLHNEIEVWDTSNTLACESSSVLLLRDSIHEKSNNLEARIEAAKSLAESRGAKIFELWTRGKSELARLLSLSYLGDFASVYLAMSRGIDPAVIHNIEHVKKLGTTTTNVLQKEIM
jgi:glucose/mannose-6-phosphate isomerase